MHNKVTITTNKSSFTMNDTIIINDIDFSISQCSKHTKDILSLLLSLQDVMERLNTVYAELDQDLKFPSFDGLEKDIDEVLNNCKVNNANTVVHNNDSSN